MSSLVRTKKLRLYLLRPSRYDDDGYVVRHLRGVLPSNTLMCVAVEVHVLDETVMRRPVGRICRAARDAGSVTVVALAGVQSNQFPRAADLASTFRRAGVTVLLGGFHVSGVMALQPAIPADIQRLMDEGVTIVKGEVEDVWAELLRDAMAGRLALLYDFMGR
jgi:hypothetical protein